MKGIKGIMIGIASLVMLLGNTAFSNNAELVKAIENGNIETVRMLLENGANPNVGYIDSGYTPLMAASGYRGSLEMAKLLISYGAGVNKFTDQRRTALVESLGYGQVEITKLLIKEGANVNFIDENGFSPLMHAYLSDSAKALINAGANIHLSLIHI